jgi:hypothetical protein
MKMNKFTRYILKKICKKLVIQSHAHAQNIAEYFEIMRDACRNEFIEDNEITLDVFLQECFDNSKKV